MINWSIEYVWLLNDKNIYIVWMLHVMFFVYLFFILLLYMYRIHFRLDFCVIALSVNPVIQKWTQRVSLNKEHFGNGSNDNFCPKREMERGRARDGQKSKVILFYFSIPYDYLYSNLILCSNENECFFRDFRKTKQTKNSTLIPENIDHKGSQRITF